MKNEPIIVRAAVTLAGAIIAVLVAFNVPITDQQQDAILGLIPAVAVVVLLLWSRPAVTPNGKVAAFDTGREIVAGPAAKVADGTRVAVRPDAVEGE